MSDGGAVPTAAVPISRSGRRSGRSRYREVAEVLRRRILAGALPPAAPLPSEAQMIVEHGVSRPTVRAAVALLVSEGLVVTLPGRGSFVRRANEQPSVTYQRAVRPSADGTPPYLDATLNDPRWRLVEESRTHRTEAGPDVARALGVLEDVPVTVVDQLYADSADHRLAHRLHVPPTVHPPTGGTDLPADPASIYGALVSAGHRLHWTESVRARMPSSADAEVLSIVAGTPMLTIRRTTFDQHRRPLLFEETHVSADDAQLVYRLDPPDAPAR